MTWLIDQLKNSGTKRYCHLTTDNERELERAAQRLKVSVKKGKKEKMPHLDLDAHKRELALRYGAIEM